MERQIDPDSVSTLFGYDGKGEREYTVLDVSENGTIDFQGASGAATTTWAYTPDRGWLDYKGYEGGSRYTLYDFRLKGAKRTRGYSCPTDRVERDSFPLG